MVAELSPSGLLRTVIVLVVIYYGTKFLFRWWLKMKVNSAMKERERTVSQEEAHFKKNETGKVHIKSKGPSSSHNSSGGEYVDYEEVD